MGIVPRAASGDSGWAGTPPPGCGTWTGSFYLWAGVWRRVKGSETGSGCGGAARGGPCGGPEEDLCTCWDKRHVSVALVVHRGVGVQRAAGS